MPLRDKNQFVRFFLRPGAWFCFALALGAVIRFYLVVFTEGTTDVAIWEQHAAGVRSLGLIGYYHANGYMNHPPFIGWVEGFLLGVAQATGIPFKILLRAPFALFDAGTMLVLLRLLSDKPWRFAAAAAYWLNPVSIIFSAYHGNTDSAVAFFVLLCVYLLSKGNVMGGGIALGASFWIKLPGTMAAPALFFFVQGWRKRLAFVLATGIMAALTYLPAVCQDARIVHANVFGYRGQILQTVNGTPIWGPRVLLSSLLPSPDTWPAGCVSLAGFFIRHSWFIALALLLLLVWLRRNRRSASETCATIAAGYAILYGFTDNWSFQYLAWSVPFWFFLRPWFFIPATILAGGYIYSLYWFLCGNPWLLGNWDFVGRPEWPPVVVTFRNLAVLFFFLSGCVFLISALKEQIIAWAKASNTSGPASR